MHHSDAQVQPPSLQYERRGAETPLRTRIVVERNDDGVRFLDPPLAGSGMGRRVAIRCAVWCVATLVVVGTIGVAWRLKPAYVCGFAIVGIVLHVVAASHRWARSAKHPTVIDAAPGVLVITLPSHQRISVNTDGSGIRSSAPRRVIGVGARVSSLLIDIPGRRLRLFAWHDYLELRWLARQLRLAVGHPVDHSGEPALHEMPVEDDLITGAPDSSSAIALSVPSRVATSPTAARANTDARGASTASFLAREYDEMSVATALTFYAIALAGMPVIAPLMGMLEISLQYGWNAYAHGLRFVPHKSPLLTNGSSVGAPYQLLGVILWIVAYPCWVVASFLMVVGCTRVARGVRRLLHISRYAGR